jgi:hypothetical protein
VKLEISDTRIKYLISHSCVESRNHLHLSTGRDSHWRDEFACNQMPIQPPLLLRNCLPKHTDFTFSASEDARWTEDEESAGERRLMPGCTNVRDASSVPIVPFCWSLVSGVLRYFVSSSQVRCTWHRYLHRPVVRRLFGPSFCDDGGGGTNLRAGPLIQTWYFVHGPFIMILSCTVRVCVRERERRLLSRLGSLHCIFVRKICIWFRFCWTFSMSRATYILRVVRTF